ncbi:MAG: Ig-like domain-containing protein, partial [Kofleriaceae bacterium]
GATAGSYTVTATVGELAPVGFALANVAGAAAAIEIVDGDAQSVTVTEPFAALRVRVRDASGNPVAGEAVTFTAPTTAASVGFAAPAPITDAQGLTAITATANAIAGGLTVTARIEAGATATFQLTSTADVPATITVAATASPQAMTVLQAFSEPLAVTVTDRFGNPTPNIVVAYSVPAAPTATLDVATATTDAAGHAHVSATAGVTSGAYVVRAAVTGIPDAAVFSLTNLAGPPATIGLLAGDPQSAVVDTAFATALSVVVRDADGNGVPNAVVAFAAPAQDVTAILTSSSAASDGNGIATMLARAGTVTGTYAVTATLAGAASPVAFTLTNTPGSAATITASTGSTPQRAAVTTDFVQPLVATVTDAFGNAVPGLAVTYTAPTTGATGTLAAATAITAGDGRCALAITAGSVAGGYLVTATTTGITVPATFELTNLAGPAQTIRAFAGAAQEAVVATAFTAAIDAIVEDAQGNPVADAEVTFVAPATGASALVATATTVTDASGHATTVVSANTVAGAFTLVALTPLGAAPAAFELVNLPGAPATVTAVSGTPQAIEVSHGFALPLVVAVADAHGNRVPDAQVDFVTASHPGATLSTTSLTTDVDGQAHVLAVADTVIGTFSVVATVEGATAATFILTNLASAPGQVLVRTGGAQHVLATTAFAPVTFQIVDAFGNAVAGATLVVEVPSAGATAILGATLPSDANGEVTVALTAGAEVGSFVLSAHATGALTPATTTLTVDAIPTTMAVSGPGQVAVDQPVFITVVVSAAIGTPTGTVTIAGADGRDLGTAVLANGSATLELATQPLGSHTFVVRYAAQGSYGASADGTVTVETLDDSGSLSGSGGCSVGGSGGGALALVLLALVLGRGRRRVQLAGLMVAVSMMQAGSAAADDPAGARAIDRYQVAAADSSWFTVDSIAFAGHRDVALLLVGDYALRPLIAYDADGSERARIVTDSFVLHFGGSVTLVDRVRLSANVPMAVYQDGNGATYNGMPLPSPIAAFGDVSVAGDVRVSGTSIGPFRIAVGGRLALPTGSRTNFMSDGVVGFEPRVLVAGTQGPIEYAAAASALLRSTTMMAGEPFGSELRFAAGVGARLARGRLLVGPELTSATPFTHGLANGTPLELELGAHYTITDHLRIGLAACLGIINAPGTPSNRGLLAFAWNP